MGNFQTGIKDEGTTQTIRCKDCTTMFEGKVGVVTIKGPSHDPVLCSGCQHSQNEKMHGHLITSLNKNNGTPTADCKHEDLEKPMNKITLHYANWCKHSKDMLPEWKIFENYARDHLPTLTVRKICYDHIADDLMVKSYPTIILKLIGKNPIIFNYDRRVEYFIKFVKENMSNTKNTSDVLATDYT